MTEAFTQASFTRRPGPSAGWTWAAAGLGLLLAIVASFPGYMTYDPLEQLRQARSGQLGDWFPPVMALLWRFLDQAAPGPAGMLLVQLVMLWAGLALVALHTVRRAWAPFLVLALGLWPPLFALSGTIWKDVQMLAAFVLAIGCLLSVQRGKRLWPLAGAALLLLYGGALRHNALLPVLPLALWAGVLAGQRLPLASLTLKRLSGSLLVVVLLAAPPLLNRSLVNAPDPPVQQVLFSFDLFGIAALSGQNVVPAYSYTKPLDVEALEAMYRRYSDTAVGVHYTPDGLELKLLTDHALVDDMGQRWLTAIREHPWAYLRHRNQLFVTMMGLREAVPPPYFRDVPTPHQEAMAIAEGLKLDLTPTPMASAVTAQLDRLLPWPIFRLWPYVLTLGLCLAAVLPGLLRRRPWALVAAALAVSGLCNSLPLYLLAPAVDWRYHYWTMVATLLAVVFTLAHLRARQPARGSR